MDLDAIIFMKFGYHALESDQDILVRKQSEYKNTGKIFWGYGGTLCHPLNQIQPFVSSMNAKGKKVYLAMSFTASKPSMEATQSQLFSIDNMNWSDIPNGIRVTGSKYAIVCSELHKCDIKINLRDYEVAIGPSQGKLASDYIGFRVDKGCFIKKNESAIIGNEVNVQLLAEIVEPDAILLR